jgi:3-oxoacyl-[acyl-carrier-protein] synthase-3
MLFNDLYVAGVASWLPAREPLGPGRYEPEEQAEHGYDSVSVAGLDETPPDMAIRVGRQALARARVDPAEVSLLLHAFVWYQGLDFWSPASYIHQALLGDNPTAQAIDVNQMCSGAMSAVQLAADHLVADPGRRAAIVTTADRFLSPGFDRWQVEGASIVYGDGAGALVLARGRGFARLLAVRSVADTTLEPMNRGDAEFALFSSASQRPVDNQLRRAEFFRQRDVHQVIDRINAGLAGAVNGLLEEAGLSIADVSRFVFPNVGLGMLNEFVKLFGIEVSQTVRELGRTTGHVGAADPITGLAYLLEQGELSVGDRVVLVGIGYGFFWSCALVECVEIPDWAAAG